MKEIEYRMNMLKIQPEHKLFRLYLIFNCFLHIIKVVYFVLNKIKHYNLIDIWQINIIIIVSFT